MQIALPIGKNIFMRSDVRERMGKIYARENRFKIPINLESRKEADKLFNGLSKGGQIEVPNEDSPLG